jgi:hypothetical protein
MLKKYITASAGTEVFSSWECLAFGLHCLYIHYIHIVLVAVLIFFVYNRLYIQPSILIHKVYVKYYSTVFSETQELLRLLLVVT